MALRIISGRAGSGKTRLCLNEIGERFKAGSGGGYGIGNNGGMLFYLVPEQSNLEAEHGLFSRIGADGAINAAVITFRRMSHRVFSELGGQGGRYISASGKKICLSSIVAGQRDNLSFYRSQSRTRGFIDELAELFSEFKKNKIDPINIPGIPDGSGRTQDDKPFGPRLSQKFAELSSLYKLYCERVESEYLDAEDDLTRLAPVIRESRIIAGAEFWIDGFYGFTEQEYDIVRELIKHAKNVTICLCRDGASPSSLFNPVNETLAELLKRADCVNAAVTETHLTPVCANPDVRPEIRYIEKNIFQKRPMAYDGANEAVYLRCCADGYAEAEYAAGAVLTLCRERNYRYGDVAIICSDLDAYAALIKPVFVRYGIRCFIDVKNDISEHPIIRLVLSLFSIIESGYSFESVFSYLKTGLTNVSRDETDRLENFALARGIRGNLWKEAGVWEGSGLDGIRTRFLKPVSRFGESARKTCSATDFCAALYDFFEKCGAGRSVREFLANAARSPEGGGMSVYSEWKQIWGYFIEILDQIAELDKRGNGIAARDQKDDDGATPYAVFAEMFKCGVNSYKVGTIPPSADEILVGSVNRTIGRNVKALFILGANEGMFPGSQKPASLLNDDNRIELRARGVNVAKDSASLSYDSQFRVYRAVNMPVRYLFVSWSAETSGGKTAKPAYAVNLLHRMFPDNTAFESDFNINTASKTGALETMIGETGRSGPVPSDSGLKWAAVREWFIGDIRYAPALNVISQSRRYRDARVRIDNRNERAEAPERGDRAVLSENREAAALQDRKITAGLPDRDGIGVSRLERYSACPFLYMCEHLVKARPRKEYKLEAPDIGSFVHKAIELTSISISGGWDGADIGECRERASEVVETMLADTDAKYAGDAAGLLASGGRNGYQKERIKETAAWGVFATARQINAGAYRPWKYEFSFNGGMGEGSAQINLRGIIDRVDIAEVDGKTYVRVIDIKTGHRKISVCDIANGLTLQLPVYLDAALKAVAADGPEPVQTVPGGLFYFETRRPFLNMRNTGRPETVEAGGDNESLLDELTLDGFIIGDENYYENAYEKDIRAKKNSGIIKKMSFKKDGMFTARVFAPDPEDYGVIQRAVESGVRAICAGIENGVFDVNPYKKKGASPCAYCGYGGACGIDLIKRNTAYRVITEKNDREYLRMLREREGD